MSRSRSLVVIAVIVAALLGVWWIDRGRDRGPRRIERPAPLPRVAAPDAVDVSSIVDPTERAAVAALAAGGPPADAGAVFDDAGHALPARPPRYWRAYDVAGRARLVAGERGELYYTRDGGRTFTALRGARP